MRPLLLTVLLPSLTAAGGFQRLHAEQATATSFLKSNWNKYEENYHPSYVLDDDVKTAWVEGAEGDGIGESLTIPVSALKSARAIRLVVFNGYQKSKALLSANSAPRQLTVTVRGPGGQESAKTQLTLERKMGPQSFDIPVTGAVADVVLTVDSVHPGSKYKDTCVSDVQVFVDSDVPYNAAVEKGKHEALLQWKKERLEAAKYFARLPKSYPFASSRFEQKVEQKLLSKRYARVLDEDKDGHAEKGVPARDFVPLLTQVEKGQLAGPLAEPDKALIQELGKLAAAPPQEGKWYSLTQRGRVVLPENFSYPEDFSLSPLMVPLFNLSEATLFEAKGRGSLTPRLSDDEGYRHGTVLSNLLVLEGSATDVKKVYFTQTHVVVERTSSTTTTHAIALLEGGRLTRLVTLETSEDDLGSPIVTVGVTTATYTNGKVSRLERTELVDSNSEYEGVDPESGISVRKATSEAVSST
ncbi:MAG TPA: hypothetical protein VFZ09_24245 [Archangium sp.]|uniref:NADase-type glycan-binding domain-containing protein n=1 Tax=Archangium sp. TaxID=1872627 RepID=UPI002E328F31|nr:hypothetical protein [Archangium sp.]HEX5749361.1 hypothetical protein [Archangium sp.]